MALASPRPQSLVAMADSAGVQFGLTDPSPLSPPPPPPQIAQLTHVAESCKCPSHRHSTSAAPDCAAFALPRHRQAAETPIAASRWPHTRSSSAACPYIVGDSARRHTEDGTRMEKEKANKQNSNSCAQNLFMLSFQFYLSIIWDKSSQEKTTEHCEPICLSVCPSSWPYFNKYAIFQFFRMFCFLTIMVRVSTVKEAFP